MLEVVKILAYDDFIRDYNKFYKTNVRTVYTDTFGLDKIMSDLYGAYDFNIDNETEDITVYTNIGTEDELTITAI